MLENLHRTKELGRAELRAAEAGDLEGYAELMHEHWEHKRRRSPGMANEHIDRLYMLARRSGVIGGKLVGAGGGGFLLVYAPRPEDTRQAMAAAGRLGAAVRLRVRRRATPASTRERHCASAIVGCGLIGAKRAAALGPEDELVGCFDVDRPPPRRSPQRARARGRSRTLRGAARAASPTWSSSRPPTTSSRAWPNARCRPAPTCSSRSPPGSRVARRSSG